MGQSSVIKLRWICFPGNEAADHVAHNAVAKGLIPMFRTAGLRSVAKKLSQESIEDEG